MKKYLILTIAALLFLTTAQAQQYTEVVYLKNGSMIRGTVVEQTPGESLKIRTTDGSLFVYRMDEVEKIVKEEARKGSNNLPGTGVTYRGHLDLGYVLNARTGGGLLSRVELTSSHGVMIKPYLFVGAGIGLTYFHDIDAFTLPIFANARISLPLNKVSIFMDSKIGYAMGLTSSSDGGLYLTPSVGISIRKIDLSFGYVAQYVRTIDKYGYGENVNMGALALRFGVKF